MALGQNYGTSTASIMDAPLALKSVFAPYAGDNGYKFTSAATIQVVNTPDVALVNYNEASTTGATPTLVQNNLQILTLDYNKAAFGKIQATLIQDTPVASFAAKWAKQQIDDVFIPSHDIYSLSKVIAGRTAGNDVMVTLATGAFPATGASKAFGDAFVNIRKTGADATNTIAWVTDSMANALTNEISFTGSDVGYKGAVNSAFLGKFKGVTCVAVPDTYLGTLGASSKNQVWAVLADKRAIVNVTPKMSPSDYKVVTELSGFSGVEVQIRDRSDTFLLDKKKDNVAVIRTTGAIS